jgi:hypothetical protein
MVDDIVTRIRRMVAGTTAPWQRSPLEHAAMEAAAKIERLRDAGDGLVAVISNCECVANERCGWCIAKDKWEEARRG